MGPAIRLAPFAVILLGSLRAASVDPSNYRFYREIDVAAPRQLCTVPIDKAVYLGAESGLPDLRLLHDGHEVPYVRETLSGAYATTEFPAEIENRAVLPRAGLQLTLDLATSVRHNRLLITTGKRDFRSRVTIETSADDRNWAVVRSGAYIFSFTQDGLRTDSLYIDYPLSTRRFLRVTLAGFTEADDVERVQVTRLDAQPASWLTLATLEPAQVEQDRSSSIEFDLGSDHLPVSRLRVDAGGPPFHRGAAIETSDDRRDWTTAANTVIYRFPEDLAAAPIDIPEQHHRYLRLKIFNRDDQPVPLRKVYFEALAQRVRFLAADAGTYRLYYGAPDAVQPQYDLPAILNNRKPSPEVQLPLGPQRSNPDFRPSAIPQKPWSERHPELIYGTLAAALIGMGWISFRFLRGLRSSA